MKTKTTRTKKQTLWQKRIHDWHNSGLKPSEFCLRNKLQLPTFQYWKRKVEDSSPKTEGPFVEVPSKVQVTTAVNDSRFEISFPSGIRLTVQQDFNDEIFRRLIKTLSETVC